MVVKDPVKRIEDLTEKIKKLEAQKKQIEARENEKARKARTRRLIQIGAIMDSMGINTADLAENLKNYLNANEQFKEWLQNINQHQ